MRSRPESSRYFGAEVTLVAKGEAGEKRVVVNVRVDTPKEWEYYENGGILQYVLRSLAA